MINKTWKKLITELMERDITFDVINNVLSFKGLPEECRGLWLWFGEIRVADHGDKTAGDMLILENFSFDENNELIVYTRGASNE